MSYFDDASLVMIPSGYKTSKVYSVKPTDGTGDLTFTRSNDTATRVNSAGLIEKVRTNLALYSQDLTNAIYIKTNATITANSEIAPDGTLTADTITATGTSGNAQGVVTITSGLVYTMSVWLKRKTGTGTIQLRGVSNTSTTVTITSEWARYSVTLTAADVYGRYGVLLSTSGDEVYAWGFQLEASDVMTDYIPTTTAAVSVGPVANVPRLDYLGSSCPRLLLEPQTTALNQFSESFDNAYWIKNDVTIEANTTETLDPSGYYGADKITETATTARHRLLSGAVTMSAVNNTSSVFLKKGTARYGFVTMSGAATSTIVVDLEDGTITSTSTSGTIVAQKVENYGGGWYRISVTALGIAAPTSANLQFGPAGSATPSYTANIPSFAGSTSNYLYAWGANLTATSYVQSYIPTLGAAVTRGADACSKTGISSLIGQTEGTIYTEFVGNEPSVFGTFSCTLTDGTNGNFIQAGYSPISGGVTTLVRVGGIAQVNTSVASTINAGTNKLAIAYKQNDYIYYLNGVAIISDTSALVPACSNFVVGNNYNLTNTEKVVVAQALLFKTRLSNADLAALTA